MVEIKGIYKNAETNRYIRVLEKLKGDYYKVAHKDTDIYSGDTCALHASQIVDTDINDYDNINLGSVYPFNDKMLMTQIYLIIKFQLNTDFSGFNYVDENNFFTKIGNENKQFSVHKTEYDKDFFVWNKKTFIDRADFFWIMGVDYGIVLHKKSVYERITNGFVKDKHDNQKSYFKLPNGDVGAIHIDKKGNQFACRMHLIEDLCAIYTE